MWLCQYYFVAHPRATNFFMTHQLATMRRKTISAPEQKGHCNLFHPFDFVQEVPPSAWSHTTRFYLRSLFLDNIKGVDGVLLIKNDWLFHVCLDKENIILLYAIFYHKSTKFPSFLMGASISSYFFAREPRTALTASSVNSAL